MNTRTNRNDAPPTGVTTTLTGRRTVAKGIAWTVPVVAVATAAPAFAASCETFTFGGGSCKCPGNSSTPDNFGYWLFICYNCPPGTVNATGVASITAIRNTPNGDPMLVSPKPNACSATGYPIAVPPNGCTQQVHLTGTSSGANLYIDWKVDGVVQPQFTIKAPPDCAPVLDANGTVVAQSKCYTAGSCP